jgi:hypothetical protein
VHSAKANRSTGKKLRKVLTSTSAVVLFIAAMAIVPSLLQQPAHAHFLGTIKTVDGNYQVAFQQNPQLVNPGANATLHFSVLKDSAPAGSMYAAMQVQEKETGKIVEQMPYKWYEVGDITTPYTFKDSGDYSVTLLMRMDDGNAQHKAEPLSVGFDVAVKDRPVISPLELLAGALPFTAALVGGIIAVFKKVK